MCALIGASVRAGIGHYRGPIDAGLVAQLIVANNTLWSILINTTKASILTQYLRVFPSRPVRHLSYALLGSLAPALAWGVFGGIFLCSPAAKLWSPTALGGGGHCRNAQTYWASVAAVDIALDLGILVLPLPAIVGLRLPWRQKLPTLLVFVLGFTVCVVSVARLATVLATARAGDWVMSGIWSIIWSTVEANIGIICASLLSLKALLVTRRQNDDGGDDGAHPEITARPHQHHHHHPALWIHRIRTFHVSTTTNTTTSSTANNTSHDSENHPITTSRPWRRWDSAVTFPDPRTRPHPRAQPHPRLLHGDTTNSTTTRVDSPPSSIASDAVSGSVWSGNMPSTTTTTIGRAPSPGVGLPPVFGERDSSGGGEEEREAGRVDVMQILREDSS
jgi:hypothetical protein